MFENGAYFRIDLATMDVLLLVLLVSCAVLSLQVKGILSATVMLGAYSFLMCILWAGMGAVDVAFTEAAVGAGVSTIFFLCTILRTTRNTSD